MSVTGECEERDVNDYVMNKVVFEYTGLDEAFPPVDPGVKPFGSRVLVQIRLPKHKTKGGLLLIGETRDTEAWNTQVAVVRSIGELAFPRKPKVSLCPHSDTNTGMSS